MSGVREVEMEAVGGAHALRGACHAPAPPLATANARTVPNTPPTSCCRQRPLVAAITKLRVASESI
jgi:hypothetical protein